MTQTVSPASDILTSYITWLKAHERLVIIVFFGWLGWHFYGKAVDTWVDHDKRVVSVQQQSAQNAQQKVTQDTQQGSVLLQQLATIQAQYTILSSQVQSAIKSRQQTLQAQVQTNDSADAAYIASRTASLISVDPAQIVTSSDGGVTLSNHAAHVNADQLEGGNSAILNNSSLNASLAECQVLSAKQDETITTGKNLLADERASHQQDVKLEQDKTKLANDNAKKQFRKGLKWGAIAGFVGGLLTFHYI